MKSSFNAYAFIGLGLLASGCTSMPANDAPQLNPSGSVEEPILSPDKIQNSSGLSLATIAENCNQLRVSFENLSLQDPNFSQKQIEHIYGFMNSLRAISKSNTNASDIKEAQNACYMPGSTVDPKYYLYEIAQECREYLDDIKGTKDQELRETAMRGLARANLFLEEQAQQTVVPTTVTYECLLNLQ